MPNNLGPGTEFSHFAADLLCANQLENPLGSCDLVPMPSRESVEAIMGDLSRSWGWLLGIGIVFVLLGTIGVGMAVALTLVSVLYIGVMIMIGGAAQLIHAYKGRGWKTVLPSTITGGLYLVAGFSVIRNPAAASTLITLILAGTLIVIGIMRVWMAFQMKGSRQWVWPLLGGLASVAIGLMILSHWPISGTWVIGMFLAIDLMVNGWSCIAIAVAARNSTREEAGSADSES